jgi:hypothetical protein
MHAEVEKMEVMMTRNRLPPNRYPNRNGGDRNGRPANKCDHCGKFGHSKRTCYELVGYPQGWDKSRNSRINNRASVAEIQDEPDHVDTKASAFITTAGDDGKTLKVYASVLNNTWVIDSGTTAHMTSGSRQIKTLEPSTQTTVTTANGNTAPIIGEGTITLDNLNLYTVLVVPSLDYNLLSVSQLTIALQCVVIFWPNSCVFKDI